VEADEPAACHAPTVTSPATGREITLHRDGRCATNA
jgi:hypothetical protein